MLFTIPALRAQTGLCEFKASQGYELRPCFLKQQQKSKGAMKMLFCGKLPACVLERTVAFQQEEEVSFAKYSNSRFMTTAFQNLVN